MARDFPGIPFSSLPEPNAPDFTPRLRNILGTIHHWAQDQSNGMARITQGEIPNSSGSSSGVTDHGLLTGLSDDDHAQYLLLAGRNAGQTVSALSGQTANVLEFKDTTGTSRAAVTPAGHIIAGGTSYTTTSPTGSAVLQAGRSGFNALRATAFDAGAIALHAIGALSTSYALRVALGATNPDAAGIMADGRAAFGALPESNCALLANSVAAAGVVSKVRGFAAQSANLTEWQNSTGTVLASVDANGVLVPSAGMNTPGFVMSVNGISDVIALEATGSGNVATLDFTAVGTGDTFSLTSGGGNILTDQSTATLPVSYTYKMTTGGGGFVDSTTTTKGLRFDLTGITAATVRNARWFDQSGAVVQVGRTTSASGTLGTIALTAQTASLAAQTLLTGNASSAGLYRVSFYIKTTTAGDASDNLTATLAWNDGGAQTEIVGFLGGGGTNSNVTPYTAHALDTNNAFSHASVVVKAAASQNITFTTTLTSPGAGTPAYSIDARIEALG